MAKSQLGIRKVWDCRFIQAERLIYTIDAKSPVDQLLVLMKSRRSSYYLAMLLSPYRDRLDWHVLLGMPVLLLKTGGDISPLLAIDGIN
jgi:hypothetical protein